MRAVLLALALLLSAVGGGALGAALYDWRADARKKTGRNRLTTDEAIESPVVLFVSLFAIGCVAGAAFSLWIIPPAALVSAFVARNAPKRALQRREHQRREECERHLDMMCDIVAMGVDAGLSFDSALELYCDRFDNMLSQELKLAYGQWSHGLAGREEALDQLTNKIGSPAFKRFSDTAVHAVARGAPLAGMLRKYAVELRRSRRVCIERKVEQAPIKMLIPTGVCILPAMLVLVMGPMMLQFLNT